MKFAERSHRQRLDGVWGDGGLPPPIPDGEAGIAIVDRKRKVAGSIPVATTTTTCYVRASSVGIASFICRMRCDVEDFRPWTFLIASNKNLLSSDDLFARVLRFGGLRYTGSTGQRFATARVYCCDDQRVNVSYVSRVQGAAHMAGTHRKHRQRKAVSHRRWTPSLAAAAVTATSLTTALSTGATVTVVAGRGSRRADHTRQLDGSDLRQLRLLQP